MCHLQVASIAYRWPRRKFHGDMGTKQTKEHCQISTAPKNKEENTIFSFAENTSTIHVHDKSTTAIQTLIYLFNLINKIKQNKTLVEI